MMPAASIQQVVWPRVITLCKIFWHLRSALDPGVFAGLFRRFVVWLDFLRSKRQIWYGKKGCSKSPSSNPGSSDGGKSCDQVSEHLKEADTTNINQVIPLDNISCSLYPYGTGLRDASRSSHMVNASRSSHNLGIISRSQNTSRSSHGIELDDAQIPFGGGYTFTIEHTSPRRTYSMSSPELVRPRAADIHEAILPRRSRIPQILPQPRSDSPVESIQLLSPGEFSSSHVRIVPAEEPPIVQSTNSQIHISSDDLSIPALDHPRIYPVAPENFQRYEKRRRIPNKATRAKMKPLLIDFSEHSDPPGWALCIHPEGACYFYNAEKRVFTDADLYDSAFFKRIVRHINIIETFIDDNHIPIPEGTDLVLDINQNTDGIYVTDYYFANHRLRTIFFLDDFSTDYLPNWEEIKGVNSGRHLRHQMETQYWWHCLSYPNCLDLSDDLICELRDIAMYFIGDSMTSRYSTSPYTLDDLYKILSLVNDLKENIGKPYSGCSSLFSRFMFVFSHMKFYHFHGLPEARLNRDQSVFGTRTNQRTWFIKIFSIFLFSAPDVHLKTLQKMWVDGVLHKAVWETSVKKMGDEWREFILYATVLLNANVAFLAIQSVDVNNDPFRSAAQISSYCSVCASVGSIILGLLLVRQNQTKNRDAPVAMQRFLRTKAHRLFGLEILALLFSLPYALLMWGMVSFLTAFLFMCLQHSGTVPRSVIGSLCGVIAILIVWCILTSWEKYPASDAVDAEEKFPFEVNEDDDSGERPKNFVFEVVSEYTEEPQPSMLGLRLSLPFAWPAFLRSQPRRQSYDSNGTVVGDA